jgi:hypothetical protein
VVVVDWGEHLTEIDCGLDIVKAIQTALRKSAEGNTDYCLLFNGPLPTMKFQDGEKVKL